MQLYPSVPQENKMIPKNYFKERFQALGVPYRQVRRNCEMFSVDIVPTLYRGRTRNLLVFSGLGSKFSAVYDLGSAKSASATNSALLQFITNHGIPAEIITDGDQAENFSQKWVETCTKYHITQHCLEAFKQNQNYVERWVQMAKGVISKIKQVTGCDDKYAYDMWQHVSDVANHMAQRSLKWQTPLESFCGETSNLSITQFKF